MTDNQQGRRSSLESTDDFGKIVDFIATRHASLEQRGISVVTTTSALVTLLLALSGLAGDQSKFTTDKNDLSLLPWALISLVLAVIFGLLVNYPLTFKPPPWPLKLNDSAKRLLHINYIKSWILTGALVCQTIGIVFLAVVVWNILSN
jgi:hypothetical protein